MKNAKNIRKTRRKKSIRKNIFGTQAKPRLTVFRSNLHIYGQIIDDNSGKTLVSANSNSDEVKNILSGIEDLKGKTTIAFAVGEVLGKKALESNLSEIVFDRNGYLYHGRVKSLADGVRKAGIKF